MFQTLVMITIKQFWDSSESVLGQTIKVWGKPRGDFQITTFFIIRPSGLVGNFGFGRFIPEVATSGLW